MTERDANTNVGVSIGTRIEDVIMTKIKPIVKSPHYDGPISTLPNEILSHILSCLDAHRDLSEGLLDEPCFDLTNSKIANLKAAACVSKQWRQAAFPMLFKHLRFVVPEPKDIRLALDDQIKPFLDFAKSNTLDSIIESFVLIVKDAKVHTKGQLPGLKSADSFSSFWSTIFDLLDPPDLLIIAPLEALANLAACDNTEQDEAWNFDCPCHYLQLVQNKPSKTSQIASGSEPLNSFNRARRLPENSTGGPASSKEIQTLQTALSTLLQGRPWTKFLLNEGSFVKAYGTYEWWERVVPSILSDVVGLHDRQALISPTVRDFSYIAIFPFMNHFQYLVKKLPRLDRLYTQFVPRNEIMQDRKKMAQVEPTDLWTERNGCYSVLMRELFNAPPEDNYRYLKEFESGDAADKYAWNLAVEYVKHVGTGWKVASDGVFVRDPVRADEATTEGDEGHETQQSVLSV